MFNFDQALALIVLVYLVVTSYIDIKQRKTYVLPWLVICGVGVTMLLNTIIIGQVPLSAISYFLAIMFIPLVIPAVLMYFQKFQLGDILAFIGIGLAIPISPFLLVSVFPFNLMSIAVYLNSLFLWFVYSTVKKRFKDNLPFLPFLTLGFCLALIGL